MKQPASVTSPLMARGQALLAVQWTARPPLVAERRSSRYAKQSDPAFSGQLSQPSHLHL